MAARGRPRAFDRDEALGQAMALFWEHGYEGVSVADLSRAMGINAPSLYAAFGCKEELFRAAVGLYEQRHGLELPDRVSAREAVAGLLRAGALGYAEPERPHGCLVVHGADSYTTGTKAVREFLGERRRVARDALLSRLAWAVAEGELGADVDITTVADFYLTVLHGMSTQARDGVTRSTLLNVADAAMAAWGQLISAEAQAH